MPLVVRAVLVAVLRLLMVALLVRMVDRRVVLRLKPRRVVAEVAAQAVVAAAVEFMAVVDDPRASRIQSAYRAMFRSKPMNNPHGNM